MMKASIVAIGTATPPYKFNQAEAAGLIAEKLKLGPAQTRLLKSVYRATGIQTRYSVMTEDSELFQSTAKRMAIYKKHASQLAIAAIKNCLVDQQTPLSEITHLITVSCTGMYAPGIDIEIVQQLQLPSTTKRTAINFMGCYGAFNGLKVADAICRADVGAKVLVVCVELCSIHFQDNQELDNLISNSIFADGAAAVLVEIPAQPKKSLSLHSFHSDLMPQTSNEMAWQIGDSGFDIVLTSYVPEVIESGIAGFSEQLLKMNYIAWSDVDFYAIHPGGSKILKACEASLNISPEHNKYSYQVLRDYGNMSSPTVLFVLQALWRELKAEDDQKNILSFAFGPGLTLESMLLRVGMTN